MKSRRTPHHEFVIPILSVLERHGGQGRTDDVYAHIEHTLMLNEYDRQTIDGSVREPYWKNQTRVAALRMREQGLLDPSEQHAIWHISDAGRDHLAASEYKLDVYPDTASTEGLVEGATSVVTINRYERNPTARKQCIDHYGCRCQICGLTLSDVYGDLATGVIHVHHLRPLAEVGHKYTLDPIRDLRPVCPNCHTILHLISPPLTIDEARALWHQHNQAT